MKSKTVWGVIARGTQCYSLLLTSQRKAYSAFVEKHQHSSLTHCPYNILKRVWVEQPRRISQIENMIESAVKNVFTEWGWCSPAGRYACTKNAWKTRILKQTINASNLKASLWSIALAPDPGALSLLQHHWQWCVNYLYAFTQDMAPRFGNVYIYQSTQKEGRKMECKENSKDKLVWQKCTEFWTEFKEIVFL